MHNNGACFLRPVQVSKRYEERISLEVIIINNLSSSEKVKDLAQGYFTSKWQSQDINSDTSHFRFSVLNLYAALFKFSLIIFIWM